MGVKEELKGMSNLKQKLTSRKFWITIATVVFIILSEGLG
ncbi:hypothetical protein Cst_c07530 [Thermoclostridium stercorarium subsp. stercorarium DSM 8532]|uniref:Uncharacterized protein n=1 Tax=Thermoclostridium stercorarium (strain ATCC 35414 / DSM 8532 / NCIMB 11754) TaxID=1121335 RepID=L7VLZ2_THES1|nr:hypothetical protein Cst_c07530 [Thermoclostridium stercorarium subsp. stercorarium DSM 8532]